MQKIDSEKLNFSDTAVQHFNKVLDDRGKGLGIKIGVKKAGCSGYEYTCLLYTSDAADDP